MGRPIGILDSGVGGLTVVKSIQKMLPNEEIIYFGDNKNMPYGNRNEDDIYRMTMAILKFFEKKNVKMVAIACNTISTIANRFRNQFNFPIVDIITPTIDHIHKMGISKMVIMGTDFTIRTKIYEKMLRTRDNNYEISTEKSPKLAEFIDRGNYNSKEIYDTVKKHLTNISEMGNFYNIVLACTHYYIVDDIFLDIDPTPNYINPGFQQAKVMRTILHESKDINKKGKGSLQIFTSGNISIYQRVINKLKMLRVQRIESIEIPAYMDNLLTMDSVVL